MTVAPWSLWTWARRAAACRCCAGMRPIRPSSWCIASPNNPREIDGGLRWDLGCIVGGVEEGLRKCAALAPEGIRSIAVDGWAVDYVRVDAGGEPLADPFCYRDERTIKAERSAHRKCSQERMRELTGIQILRINTVYQLHADTLAGTAEGQQWLNLPEYLLSRLGRRAGGGVHQCDAYAAGGALQASTGAGRSSRR